ncbi:energy transducer TonB [Labilibaculum manganireducens]|uniref:energy transducer TonB n=1 Tax=Labilibaculum manganireducens TaxID=1940525 RepID=UPI0029F59512|nr:energy transducer TonB [Labilibaculum manganireducens]
MKNILTILILFIGAQCALAQQDTTVYFRKHQPVPTIEEADFQVIVKRKNEKSSIMSELSLQNGVWKLVVDRTIKLKSENSYIVKYENKSFTRSFTEIPGGYQVEDYDHKRKFSQKGIATNLFPLLKHGQWMIYTDGILTGVDSYKLGVLTKSYITDGENHFWPNNSYANADTLAQYKDQPSDLPNDIAKFVEYPKACSKNGIGGRVLILFAVSEQGEPSDIHIFRGVEPNLNQAAAKAVQKCTGWKPAIKNGKPVKVYMIVPINFKLK